jgi:hypothetical protein
MITKIGVCFVVTIKALGLLLAEFDHFEVVYCKPCLLYNIDYLAHVEIGIRFNDG